MAFEVNMVTHGRAYLFGLDSDDFVLNQQNQKVAEDVSEKL